MLELLIPVLLVVAFHVLKTRQQRERIALLGGYLGKYQIETLMENLTEGYLRALDETDAQRREQVWHTLAVVEAELSRQVLRLADDFSKVWSERTQVSTLAWPFPYATRFFPRAAFDLRQALALHARGIAAVAANADGRAPRERGYTMTAELLLLQHTCHWFCRSRAVASARLLARHRTGYAQVLAAVTPETRQAYRELLGAAAGGAA